MSSITEIRRRLFRGDYDAALSRLYCRRQHQLAPCRDRIIQLMEGYCKTFSKSQEQQVAIFSAPGRTELGGNHTDHQRGKVLTGSVDLDALACAAPNGTSRVRIYSHGYGLTEIDSGDLSPLPAQEGTTLSLVRGVLAGIAQLGYPVSGFDAYIHSQVPGGSGLSSSACFEVLTGTIVNGLFCAGALSPRQIASIGQYAENVYFGKPSGLLDQMGCAMGGIVSIDFKDKDCPRIHKLEFDLERAGYALCIVDTGGSHAGLTADYAAVPAEMGAVAAALGKEVLSQVDEGAFYAQLARIRRQTGDRAVLRAVHYFDDCRRVEQQAAALERGDFDAFLALVKESGKSSFTYLQNVTTYRDPADQPVAVALAAAEHLLSGRGACRVHGGGFAGTIQAYVPLALVDSFRAGMDALLGEGACRVTCIRPEGGCTVID